ncbi:MAG: hypothetical protein NC237_08450 [Eubacterium sp.]|nr:hypothetical protein [Eubacterium sp.]
MDWIGVDLQDLEFISVTDSAEVKEVDGVWYYRETDLGMVRIGYRPKGTNLPYKWSGHYNSNNDCYENMAERDVWMKTHAKEINEAYTAPYTNWDLYPDEQSLPHSDMIYDALYAPGFNGGSGGSSLCYDLSNYFISCDVKNITFESTNPDVVQICKIKSGKTIDMATGKVRSNGSLGYENGSILCFYSVEKGAEADIIMTMKGSDKKKVVHITAIDDHPALDDGPQFAWGIITMPG